MTRFQVHRQQRLCVPSCDALVSHSFSVSQGAAGNPRRKLKCRPLDCDPARMRTNHMQAGRMTIRARARARRAPAPRLAPSTYTGTRYQLRRSVATAGRPRQTGGMSRDSPSGAWREQKDIDCCSVKSYRLWLFHSRSALPQYQPLSSSFPVVWFIVVQTPAHMHLQNMYHAQNVQCMLHQSPAHSVLLMRTLISLMTVIIMSGCQAKLIHRTL